MASTRTCRWISLCMVLAVFGANGPFAEAALLTTDLIVNLNGDSTSNFIASNDATPLVAVWKDLAEDGSDASQQDFGQGVITRQPQLLVNTPVPNSSTFNVLSFTRGGSVSNSQSSNSGSDTLKGKTAASARPINYGDAYTSGADAAYEAANASGLSWFMVFRSSNVESIINNNNRPFGSGSSGTSRWGAQSPIGITYANTAVSGAEWTGTYFFTKNAETPSNTVVNVSSHIRDTADSERHNDPSPLSSSNLTANTWYMLANAYDPVSGTLRTVLTTPNGSGGFSTAFDVTLNDSLLINANGMGNGGAHLGTGLATFALSGGGTNDWAFDGLMAEVLIYKSALGEIDFNSVAQYLNDKYFVVVPESRFGMFTVALIVGCVMTGVKLRRTWRKDHSSIAD